MNAHFAQLSSEERSTLARLKATLALRLADTALQVDAPLQTACSARSVDLKIGVGGLGGTIALGDDPANRARLLLFFPSAEAAVAVLSGKNGAALPLPLGLGAFKAMSTFRRASARATELLRDAAAASSVRAELLLAATLYGLEAIAGERYLARRMQIVPDGTVRVRVEDIEYFAVKRGNGIEIQKRAARAARTAASAADSADAELSFSDYRSAIEVLSGARQAVVALGSGQVRIEGLLPLVQGLFAVLDRLSWYLGVEV